MKGVVTCCFLVPEVLSEEYKGKVYGAQGTNVASATVSRSGRDRIQWITAWNGPPGRSLKWYAKLLEYHPLPWEGILSLPSDLAKHLGVCPS